MVKKRCFWIFDGIDFSIVKVWFKEGIKSQVKKSG